MTKLQIVSVPVSALKPAPYNPRKWDEHAIKMLRESMQRFGIVDPIILNGAKGRTNVVIGGHFRIKIAKELNYTELPCVYVNIPDIEREKELNLRLNRNLGAFDLKLLLEYDESFLANVGFTSEELDDIYGVDSNPERFDLNKELRKLHIEKVTVEKGEIYEIDGSRLMCGDSTIEEDVLKLMNGEKASLCLTDPPYQLDYLRGKKKNGNPTAGFGLKRNRRYLETDVLPPDFTEKWMANIAKVQAKDFSIICYENWKNIRNIWGEMEKYWKIRNMIVWHLPNRVQGFSAKYKFFNKHDIAIVASTEGYVVPNAGPESDELFQNEYETALYATSGKPTWEGYRKGKKICPTDFIEYLAADEKSSGQGIIFGTKPIEILIPYLKVLTKRGDLVVDPFGGSGSTLIGALKLGRRCHVMEKSNVYAEVLLRRWERVAGKKAKRINPSHGI